MDLDETECLKEAIHRLSSELIQMANERAKLRAEVERLKRIIARELSENDELGCEFTYVCALKEENARLRGMVDAARKWINALPEAEQDYDTRDTLAKLDGG